MAKRHAFKKVKPGEPIPVTARQPESFMFVRNGKFNSRDYGKLERMELTKSPVRDMVHELLNTYFRRATAQYFDIDAARLFHRICKRNMVK